MKRKTEWMICGVVLLLIALLLCVYLRSQLKEETEAVYFVRPTEQPAFVPDASLFVPESESEAEPEMEPYFSPVDFETLRAINTDIYAWLDIPGTEISYPLLQHSDDNSFYLRRNMKGVDDVNGALFTESSYNGKDFSDPLTVVYGHNMKNGQMFGTLQSSYSSEKSIKEHSEIVVYLPDREMHYAVFAAVPYDNRHILYNYDFTNMRTFRLFFQEILTVRAIQAVFAEDAAVSPSDKTIILSTCLVGNRNKRFLVCAKLVEPIPVNVNN